MSYQSTMDNRRVPGDAYQTAPSGTAAHSQPYQAPGATVTDAALGNVMTQFQALSMPGSAMPQTNVGVPGMAPTGAYMLSPDGQLVIAPVQPHVGTYGIGTIHDNGYGHAPSPFMAPAQWATPYTHYSAIPFQTTRGSVANYQRGGDLGHADVPGLENRRGSYSTNESAPNTPFFSGVTNRDGPRVAVGDRSTYTTPSPQGNGMVAGLINEPAAKSAALSAPLDRNLEELLAKEPAVPKAVPAVFTPANQMKTLEQSLENRIPGNRNVYIRGLHPTTDDELLLRFAARFGRVETSKAIIDTSTGACKGFGFAKFFDVRDSEMCIRGFHGLGYEVGFAQESFNSRLKAEGDDTSTNLYISNLPKNLTEMELGAIFHGYDILSSKILRDSMGNSRGVGFARFESREICDEIIKKYNGASIGEEGLLMNIRYADTPGQKELKRITAERRQFRTNEYNIGAYGTPLVGIQPQMYSAPPIRRGYGGGIPVPTAPIRTLERLRKTADVHQGGNMGQPESTPDVSINTPSSDDSDEGVTIQVGSIVTTTGSTQSSPAAKREHK